MMGLRSTDEAAFDPRFKDLFHLLPPDTRFKTARMPDSFQRGLQDIVDADGKGFLGWRTCPTELTGVSTCNSAILVKPSGIHEMDLRHVGFDSTRSFVILPSVFDPRWIVPSGNRAVARTSMALIAAYRRGSKVKRATLSAFMAMGLLPAVGDRVIVASRTRSPLEQQISATLHVDDVNLTMATGQLQEHRKSTLQIVTRSGRIAAYGKVAATPAARHNLDAEASRLKELSRSTELTGWIPEHIADFDIGDARVSLQTAGPELVGPSRFGVAHQEFLKALAQATSRTMRFGDSAMWHRMVSTFEEVCPSLSVDWQQRLGRAVRRIQGELIRDTLDLVMAHRDFGPWNCRLFENGALYVFDWELSESEVVPLYDFFHFHLASDGLWGRRVSVSETTSNLASGRRRWFPDVGDRSAGYQFLAYLIDRGLSRLRYARWRKEKEDRFLTTLAQLLDAQDAWLPRCGQH